jgi:ABC-2 type transport system permease protein
MTRTAVSRSPREVSSRTKPLTPACSTPNWGSGRGVLAICSEYSTGQIRTTVTAIPRRGVASAAEAGVLGGFVAILAQATSFAAFAVGQAILSRRQVAVSLNDPGVVRAEACAGLYLTVVTLVGFGFGAVSRRTTGAMTAMVGLIFLAWPVARALESYSTLPDRLLPVNAADDLVCTHPVGAAHAARVPTATFAVLTLIGYTIVLLAAGAWRTTRDA